MKKKQQQHRKIKRPIKLTSLLLIIAGVFSAAFGLEGFLIPNGFIDGGVTGISLLLKFLTGIPFSLLIFIINIPFILIGIRQHGKEFAVYTLMAIALLAIVLTFIQFPIITSDKLLISIFGGFFLGLGIGLTIRGGAVIDGTDILAIYVSKKTTLSIGDTLLLVNIIIFSFAAFLFTMETALYSMLTYLSASKTVDYIIKGIEEYTGVTIVSDKGIEIKEMIINDLGRGVTIYKGERGFENSAYQNKNIKIVFTVVTRLEVMKLRYEIEQIDPAAFVMMHSINEIKGGIIKRRHLA